MGTWTLRVRFGGLRVVGYRVCFRVQNFRALGFQKFVALVVLGFGELGFQKFRV